MPGTCAEIGDVGELAESMKTFGVLEPIVLAPALDAEGSVVLITGHRRRAAARVERDAAGSPMTSNVVLVPR